MLKHRLKSTITWAARLLVAVVFIFSGAVKAIDPMGMAYKLDAYLTHFSLTLPDNSLLLAAATAIAAIEFFLGIHILFGMRPKRSLGAASIFMLLMTALTVYIYLYDPVPDCGCFGDAVILSNGETLAKNIILFLATFWLLRFGLKPTRLISERSQWITSLYSLGFIIVLCCYSILMLPPVDFMPYKVGANIHEGMGGKYVTSFIYEKEGMKKSFTADNLPDSTWTFCDTHTKVLESPSMSGFELLDGSNDRTEEILSDSSHLFLLTTPSLASANEGCADRVNDIVDWCRDNNSRFYALIPIGEEKAFDDWSDLTGAAYSALTAGREEIRSMVRSNPGLILITNGTVRAKWSLRNFPKLEEPNAKIEDFLPQEGDKQTFGAVLLASVLWFVLPLLLIMTLDGLFVLKRKRNKKTTTHNRNINNKKSKTMRKKIVAGNWKMNLNLQDGKALATELKDALAADAPNCDVVICTPFIHLAPVAEILEGSVVGLGAENCADKVSGAYTGEVSAEMIKSTGAQYVILGHSERRAYYGETAEILKEKTNLALANDLKVIFCIGEVLEERESGRQNEVVKEQLEGSLFELTAKQLKNVILAYEPVWAIGTGKTATAEQAEDMHAFIRGVIADKFGAEAAEEISILYGGSCKPSNAKEIFSKPNVDGGLIGGAALKCADFKGIIDAWK